ncbi:hypothetical protein N7468_001452 [Penicillium chermesinum]|uniref:Uncharacterized protein n=1 Tax=Penicillium chermesinum TaxID=63820 RepID=A0A9W9PGK1_9EURO|nr:uncharacterized protein N7468_001452 [Penicillium chermesinum]KAJ5246469.1 hypothetical protein N7468_001452 [Penicillium chermesinum]
MSRLPSESQPAETPSPFAYCCRDTGVSPYNTIFATFLGFTLTCTTYSLFEMRLTWQHSRFRTCDRCRQWKRNYRRSPPCRKGSLLQFAAATQNGFSAPSVPRPRRTFRSLPVQ